MRDYTRIDQYINQLYKDIYPQPPDKGHTELAQKVIDHWMSKMTTCQSVLDVGAGQGFCQPMFERWNVQYEGIAIGEDVIVAQNKGYNVKRMDFSFIECPDGGVDMIFARHSLEHSPMPLLTLMEWRRVAKNWLGLILPAPEWFTYVGLNHYSVMNREQTEHLLDVAGWHPIWKDVELKTKGNGHEVAYEYWYMCEKKR